MTAKSETAKPVTAKSETAKPVAAKSETAKSETAEPKRAAKPATIPGVEKADVEVPAFKDQGERSAVVEEILAAIQSLWTGELQVFAGGDVVGSVVLSGGRIAWATCRGQSETLGVFLWRLGRISRDQLANVQEAYKQANGKKMLGRLLEESGLMSRTVLRRCILLHTRSAIAKVLSYENAAAKKVEKNRHVDERLLFGPEEVMPSEMTGSLLTEFSGLDNTWVRSWYVLSRENLILAGLSETEGYAASAIISYDGDIVTAHVEGRGVDLPILAAHVAAMLESSLRAMRSTAADDIDWIVIDCARGGLVARWLDADRRWLVFILFDETGKSSVARYALHSEWDALQLWIEQRGARVREPPPQPAIPEAPLHVPWPEHQDDDAEPAGPSPFDVKPPTGDGERRGSDIFAAVKAPPKE